MSKLRILFITSLLGVLSFFTVLYSLAFAQTGQQHTVVSLPRNETINHNYFAAGNTVTIDGTVNGDAYVVGGTVYVDGTINGDLLVAGGTVTIRGKVSQNIRAVGGTITISSKVGRNVTTLGGNTLISENAGVAGSLVSVGGTVQVYAPVGREIDAAGGQLTVGNSVGNNIMAGVGQLTLTPDAKVNGSLTYWSSNTADISQGASVSGTIVRHEPPRQQTNQEQAQRGIMAFAGIALFLKILGYVSALIVGLMLIFLLPHYSERVAASIAKSLWVNMLIGLVALIVSPVVAILLFVSLVGIPLGIALIFSILAFVYLAKIYASYTIGHWAVSLTKSKLQRGWLLAIGLVIYEIISWIPVFGWIFAILAAFTGTGALLVSERNYYDMLKIKKLL